MDKDIDFETYLFISPKKLIISVNKKKNLHLIINFSEEVFLKIYNYCLISQENFHNIII